jgi:hypothetical protein
VLKSSSPLNGFWMRAVAEMTGPLRLADMTMTGIAERE